MAGDLEAPYPLALYALVLVTGMYDWWKPRKKKKRKIQKLLFWIDNKMKKELNHIFKKFPSADIVSSSFFAWTTYISYLITWHIHWEFSSCEQLINYTLVFT